MRKKIHTETANLVILPAFQTHKKEVTTLTEEGMMVQQPEDIDFSAKLNPPAPPTHLV